MRHKWTEEEDSVAFCLYKYGGERLLFSLKTVCDKRGIPIKSMGQRVRNFQYLATDGEEGLFKSAKQSRKIYELYKETSKDGYTALVNDILKEWF